MKPQDFILANLEGRDSTECELGWNGTPVPIHQRRWEIQQLLRLYLMKKPKRVLEIGTFHGGTLFHWLQLAQPGTHVVSVDRYSEGVDNRSLYDGWRAVDVTVDAIRGDSHDHDVIEQVRGQGVFDWIVIDAGHLEQEVQGDWDAYRELINIDGLVLFHDIVKSPLDWLQVDRVWHRIQAHGFVTQEIVADPNETWGGWGIVWF